MRQLSFIQYGVRGRISAISKASSGVHHSRDIGIRQGPLWCLALAALLALLARLDAAPAVIVLRAALLHAVHALALASGLAFLWKHENARDNTLRWLATFGRPGWQKASYSIFNYLPALAAAKRSVARWHWLNCTLSPEIHFFRGLQHESQTLSCQYTLPTVNVEITDIVQNVVDNEGTAMTWNK